MPRRSTNRGGRRYGRRASQKVERAMHERKHGTLRSGSSGRRVKSRAQAIAIGLNEARREGAKVPGRGGRRPVTAGRGRESCIRVAAPNSRRPGIMESG